MITFTPIFVYRDDTNTWVPGNETFTRLEAAEKLGISRTTLWRYETKIVEPANILDYYRYVKAHPKRLDYYCIFVLIKAIEHYQGEGSYDKAAEVMKAQRALYTRQKYNQYINELIVKNQPKGRQLA